jgi:hypothetical protein
MALFNPPLYKRGNKKCPNCGQTASWVRLWLRGNWYEWSCPVCRSVLRKDGGRVMVGAVAVVLFVVGAFAFVDLWSWQLWAIVPFWVGVVAVVFLLESWLDSVVLRRAGERPGDGL